MVAVQISSDSGNPLVSCEAISFAMKSTGSREADGLDNDGLSGSLGDSTEVGGLSIIQWQRLGGGLRGVVVVQEVADVQNVVLSGHGAEMWRKKNKNRVQGTEGQKEKK